MTTLALTQGNEATDGRVTVNKTKADNEATNRKQERGAPQTSHQPPVAEKTGGHRAGARYMDTPTQPILYNNKERTAPKDGDNSTSQHRTTK